MVAWGTPSKCAPSSAPAGPGDIALGGRAMDQLIERGAALDVHRKTIAVCVRVPDERGDRGQHVRTFGTTAAELVTLRDWLEAHRVTHVALERTGVYWKTVYYDLEDAMPQALVSGTTDPDLLADLARGTLRKKLPALRHALAGRFRAHPAFLVSQHVAHLDYLDEAVGALSARIEEALAPFAAELARLDTIPGVAQRTAEVLVAEIGVDMRQFPTAQHLASWAGLCPGQNESAGKHKSGRTRAGNKWLRVALIEAASMACRTRNTAFAARYHRIARHRGHKKAVVAVAHAMLVTAYHLLARQVDYHEPGADYFDRRHAERTTRRAIRTLERQGYRVTLESAA